jgi:hypothetical protein
MLFFAPVVLARRSAQMLLAVTTPVSILFALLGAYHPWPPAYEQAHNRDPVAGLVTIPVGGNAAAWCAKEFPNATLCDWLGERFVTPDHDLRRRYLVVFFGSKGDLDTVRRFQ